MAGQAPGSSGLEPASQRSTRKREHPPSTNAQVIADSCRRTSRVEVVELEFTLRLRGTRERALSRSQSTVMVTGGAGFVGVTAVRRIAATGRHVAVVDKRSDGAERLSGVVGRDRIDSTDLTDGGATRACFLRWKPDVVVHLAAIHFIPYCNANPAETILTNAYATQNVLDACVAAGCNRVILASTADVYAVSDEPHRETDPVEPSNIYGLTKRLSEDVCRLWRSGEPGQRRLDILRLFNVIGPGETNPHLLPDIIAGAKRGALTLGNVDTRRDFVGVEEVADVIARLVDRADATELTMNVGTGRTTDARELVAIVNEFLASNLEIGVDPSRLRVSDRPVLCADTSLLDEQFPERHRSDLASAVLSTLRADGDVLLRSSLPQ